MALKVNVNSYASVGGATIYFSDTLRAADWTSLGSKQSPALIEATRYLDRLEWKDDKTVATQPLQFPRGGDTAVPNGIIEATYEIAVRLGKKPSLIDKFDDQTGSNIKRVKADTVEVEFFRSQQGKQVFSWVFPLIKDYLAPAALIVGGTVTGNDDSSSFSSLDQFGKSDGFA